MMKSAQTELMKIAFRIRERRELLNYTQTFVASKLKISQNAYSKIEAGATNVSIERLYEIADVLETDIKQFI